MRESLTATVRSDAIPSAPSRCGEDSRLAPVTHGEVTLRVVRGPDELRDLAPAWEQLLSEYSLASTFSSPDWLLSWWESFGKQQRLLVLVLLDSELRVLGVAPLSIGQERGGLYRSLRVVRLLGDGSGDSDNLDLPVRPGFEMRFAQAIVQQLIQEKRDWDICQFNTMPSASAMCRAMLETVQALRWRSFGYSRACSSITLQRDWTEYLLQLSSEDRNNLARYTRRLSKRHAVRIYRCSDENELPGCLDALFRLHQLRWQEVGEKGSFASQERREFYNRLSRRLLERRLLEFWVMELDETAAAAQFAFRFGSRVFQLQEGYDPARASDRVGFILRGAVLKQLISEGVESYDFLGGTDSYKVRWNAQPGHYRDFHFAPRATLGGAWLWAVHGAGESKNWLRDRLPAGAWNALHRINLVARGRDHGAD